MEEYGIGYTIFKFEDGKKTPVQICKARPGNMQSGINFLKSRSEFIKGNSGLAIVVMMTGFYSFMIQLFVKIT